MKYAPHEVFTPSSPAKLTFVERLQINKRIVRALKTTGTQIIVYGQSGSGKTTLIENKLEQTYEVHIRTSCMQGMSFESVLLDAFDQLEPYYLTEKNRNSESTIEASLKTQFQLISSEIKGSQKSSTGEKSFRLLPPQLTAQNLARFMGASKHCWILDDFHKIDIAEKPKLSQLMKVFMDMSSTYPDLKIICVGAVNTARQVVQYDSEMKNRVAEIKVPLMEEKEIASIVEKGFSLLGIELESKEIVHDIYHYSNGLPSICHKLCLLICESLNYGHTLAQETLSSSIEITDPMDVYSHKTINQVNTIRVEKPSSQVETQPKLKATFSDLSYAVSEYLDDASDTIKNAFDLAFKIDNSMQVLEAISEGDQEGICIDNIKSTLLEMNQELKISQLSEVLDKLQSEQGGGILTSDNEVHLFRYSTPFYMTFARSLFEHSDFRQRQTQAEMLKLLNGAFNRMQGSYE